MKFSDIEKTAIRKWAVVAGLAGLLALTGCATTSNQTTTAFDPQASASPMVPQTAPQIALTPEQQAEIVKKRFQERWDAMIARDYAKAYTYLSPATRALVSQEQFTARFSRGQFKKAEFQEAKCEEDVCMVRFLLTYDHTRMKDITTPTGEKWFFQDGEAWFNLPE
ncbi:MAG: hypothetical protein LBI35_01010 [Burkholderiales bacterium]|jgi:hypothetical protein|nr:hypothetical protein [Burkholderiales bacterium]